MQLKRRGRRYQRYTACHGITAWNTYIRCADMYIYMRLYWGTLYTEEHGWKSMKTTGLNIWGRYTVHIKTIIRCKCKIQIWKHGKISAHRFVPLSFMPTWVEAYKYKEQITTWNHILSLPQGRELWELCELWEYNFFFSVYNGHQLKVIY